MELWYTEEQTPNVRFSMRIKEHLYHEISPFQEIDFFDTYEFGRLFTLDGIIMVTEKDEFIYHDMISHVPMAVNPSIKNVLVIGGGDGGTVRELCRYKTIERIDMVEIDERVVRMCQQYFPQTACELEDERVSLYFEDGISFVKNSKTSYDLILVDSTDPIGPGEGLFTYDFYQDCFNRLTEEGILINQHESPYYPVNAREMVKAHKKIDTLFPVSMVYQFHVPTYPSGHWLFGFASKKFNPVNEIDFTKWNSLNLKTKYYNPELHVGCFALPNYVKELLND
ncbi:MAG: polyamine aminopropyltransferase [Clostridia bacterium]|nr:polyamine aminopropyltransferase [Clostridia bacterium]